MLHCHVIDIFQSEIVNDRMLRGFILFLALNDKYVWRLDSDTHGNKFEEFTNLVKEFQKLRKTSSLYFAKHISFVYLVDFHLQQF